MRLADTMGEPRDLGVQFKKGVLNVTYNPMRYTPEEIDKLQQDANKDDASARRIAELGAELIVKWDLTTQNETGDEYVIPTDADTLYKKVPVDVLTTVVKAIQKDQSAGEDDAN